MTCKFLTVAAAVALLAGSTGIAAAQAGNQSDWQQPAQQGTRATHALNMLEDYGYGQFSHFHARGQDFTADVMKDGRMMHVLIDPTSNQITPMENAGAGSAA